MDEDETGLLRCPVSGCGEVFKSMTELEAISRHCIAADNKGPDIEFHHEVLLTMCDVRKCRECGYEPKTLGMMGTRDMFTHHWKVHRSREYSDIKRFIGLIRKYRDVPIGGAPYIWTQLHEYFKRNIQKQPDFEVFKDYLKSYNKLNMDGDYLDEIIAVDRPKPFGGDYPLTKDEFLKSFPRPSSQAGLGPGGTVGNIWDIMRARYAAGEI